MNGEIVGKIDVNALVKAISVILSQNGEKVEVTAKKKGEK